MSKNFPTTALSLLLAIGFIFFGIQKFGSENIVFETLAQKSGISLFEPGIRLFTGVAEIVVALFLIDPRGRMTGALAGFGLLTGALGLHLSPWLGINVPGIGTGLFYTAVAMYVMIIVNGFLLRKAGGKIVLIEK